MGKGSRRGPLIPPPRQSPSLRAARQTEQDMHALYVASHGLHLRGEFRAAAMGYRRVMQALGPHHPVGQQGAYDLALLCHQMRINREAVLLMEFYHQAQPRNPDALYNLGIFYGGLGDLPNAARCYRHALALRPDHVATENNLGNVLREMGDLETAELCYRRILARDPVEPESRYNLSYILLLRAQFARGFALYEERWRCESYVAEYGRPDLTTPRLTREDGPCHVYVRHEQGIGDVLQMMRFLPQLVAMGHTVTFEPAVELSPWLEEIDLPEGVTLHHRNDHPPPHDRHISVVSLPHFFGVTTEADIPEPWAPQISPLRLLRMFRILGHDPRPLVGLCWAGSRGHHNDRHRSMPASDLLPLLQRPNTRFVSLQIGERGTELLATLGGATLGGGSELLDVSAHLRDYGDTAALISACTAVVTVDTSIAHCAGTLGVQTFALTSWLSEWRWMLERTDSPWYPSLTLVRQPTLGDWPATVAAAAAHLEALCPSS